MDGANTNILYFYMEKGRSARTHFWNRVRLSLTRVDMGRAGMLTCCQVPEYCTGNHEWEKDKLADSLNEILTEQKYGEYYIQPELAKLLEVEIKLPPECLLRILFRQIPCMEYLFYIGCAKGETVGGEGCLYETMLWEERQRICQLLEPYFSRINHVNLVTDEPEVYEELAEYMYEEFGIPTAYMGRLEKRMGREGKTVILDAREDYKIPWTAIPEGACYVDFWSVDEKRIFLGRMRRDVRYMSVVKFLDTLVKNGYNTIVNQT